MKIGARYKTAVDALDHFEAEGTSLDKLLNRYFRARRYIGSKDRKDIASLVYTIIRNQGLLDWWIQQQNFPISNRLRLMTSLVLNTKSLDWLSFCTGFGYCLSPATKTEQEFCETVLHTPSQDLPEDTEFSLPQWAYKDLKAVFKGQLHSLGKTLLSPASFDIRVNTLKATRIEVMKHLEAKKIEAESTPYSPFGIRLGKRHVLSNMDLYQKGCFDVQDEGSQLLGLLVAPDPAQTLLDYCAGAGGKTLLFSMLMQNKGHITATDISAAKLKQTDLRTQRAGCTNVRIKNINDLGKATFDIVFADVPCTGSGTWRRNPDLKWRYDKHRLQQTCKTQVDILENAAKYVKPGGLLAYATCSLLLTENENQVENFLKTHAHFRLTFPQKLSPCLFQTSHGIRISPEVTQTDGFFLSLLMKDSNKNDKS